MCIIAAIPVGKDVTKDILKQCWKNNPQGGGFMFSDGKKVVIVKELNSFKKYWSLYQDAKNKYPESGFVCHFRISTHGKVNLDNVHPFHVNNKLGFCHNGIIDAAPVSDAYSDTYMFNEHILKNLPINFLQNPTIVELIQGYIGRGSKLAFLNDKGEITLVHEKYGEWSDGVWYSNSGYKNYKYYDYGGRKMDYRPTTYGSYPSYNKAGSIPQFGNKLGGQTSFQQSLPNFIKDDCLGNECGSFDDGTLTPNGERNVLAPKCEYCSEVLNSSFERINGVCQNCFNAILDEERLRWRGNRRG